MRHRHATGFALLVLAGFALDARAARSLYVLTTDNRIATIPETTPGLAVMTATAVSGVTAGEALVAIDVRPQNNRLYALGFNAMTNALQLYHVTVDANGARATPIGSPPAFSDAMAQPLAIDGSAGFGMDFNPAVDRIRVVTGTGQSFRLNPNTGAPIDADLATMGTQMDGAINGGTTSLGDAAYTNNTQITPATTLYTIDHVTGKLFIQNPPNNGVQTLGTTITLNMMPLAFGSECGLDIPRGVDAMASNVPAIGKAYAALSVGGTSGLYTIDLATAAATSLGAFGLTARDIAIIPDTAPAVALSTGGGLLIRFDLRNATQTSVSMTAALNGAEHLVGIASRPSTGQLYGLGVDPTANTASLYLIDPQSGGVSTVGMPSQIQFVDAMAQPVDFANGAYGMDFNPVVDRIRVIGDTGINFRVNPITGFPVDGDLGGAAGSVAGVNPDGPINGVMGAGVAGVAYTNNVSGTMTTTLYTLDPAGNRLMIQNPPNSGTQTFARAITLGGMPFDFDPTVGIDIPPGVDAPASNADAPGAAYAALTVPGTTSLYSLDLPGGALTSMGKIFDGTVPIAGLVTWSKLQDNLFADGFE